MPEEAAVRTAVDSGDGVGSDKCLPPLGHSAGIPGPSQGLRSIVCP